MSADRIIHQSQSAPHSASEDCREKAEIVCFQIRHALEESEASIEEAVAGFMRLNDYVKEVSQAANADADLEDLRVCIDEEVRNVVTALQFHDLLKQRLNHTVSQVHAWGQAHGVSSAEGELHLFGGGSEAAPTQQEASDITLFRA